MIISLKMWPLERTQGFYKILPSELVFDPDMTHFQTCPRFHQDKHSDQVS